MPRLGKYAMVLVPAVGLIGLLAYGFSRDPRDIRSPLLGRPAPPLSLTLFDGSRFVLAQQADKVVVVNFWASWCLPCRDEAPLLEAAWVAYRERGVVVVGVNFQDAEPAARAFLGEFGLTYPNGPDAGGRIAIGYGVYGIPELFVIGRDGRIAYKHIGAIGGTVLVAKVEEALRGTVSASEGRSGRYQPIR